MSPKLDHFAALIRGVAEMKGESMFSSEPQLTHTGV